MSSLSSASAVCLLAVAVCDRVFWRATRGSTGVNVDGKRGRGRRWGEADTSGMAGLSDVKVVLDIGRKAEVVAVSNGGCVAGDQGRVLWNLGRVGLDELACFAPSLGSLQVCGARILRRASRGRCVSTMLRTCLPSEPALPSQAVWKSQSEMDAVEDGSSQPSVFLQVCCRGRPLPAAAGHCPRARALHPMRCLSAVNDVINARCAERGGRARVSW